MDVVGSEIGQKMRSAIKAKLTELGCYVDDELPDYVMVMVANKRTRAQMEDDLQLFLGDNTELFVNWLHQVLKKLQEVTVPPLKPTEREKSKERSLSKERKSKEKKEKKEKVKKDSSKKSKKKDKQKSHRKKEDKKSHKKKKSKHHEMIHPNVPPLLMNMEKVSEPSITDVFAGQILKNHGVIMDTPKDDSIEHKPILKEIKRPILPVIDPATIPSQTEPTSSNPDINDDESNPEEQNSEESDKTKKPSTITKKVSVSSTAPREEQIKEMNEIEAKIQGLKQKLVEQLDSMSDDDDFLNIRTEAEELMNDFAEDVFQEISSQAPATPPLGSFKSHSPKTLPVHKELPKDIPESLPQIELNLPKRPVRERLGVREQKNVSETKEKEDKDTQAKEKEDKNEHLNSKGKKGKRNNENTQKEDSPERFTPEKEPELRPLKSAKNRLGDPPEREKKLSVSEDSSDKSDSSSKRLTSRVSVCEGGSTRASCASVVRVRPRPRVASASSLLLRAVADAHKSLLNIPPKMEHETQKVKRALVLPMRRCVDATQKIVIQVPTNSDHSGLHENNRSHEVDDTTNKKGLKSINKDKNEYIPTTITKKFTNTDYVLSKRSENRTSTRRDDTLIIETINIHHTTVDKQKDTQFIVTMDGFNPNAFLAKKLKTEGLIDDEEEILTKPKKSVLNCKEIEKRGKEPNITTEKNKTKEQEVGLETTEEDNTDSVNDNERIQPVEENVLMKEVIRTEKTKSTEVLSTDNKVSVEVTDESPPTKKRKASPVVFDVDNKDRKERKRTESVSSDNHVTVTTTANSSKYDALPPLSLAVAAAAAAAGERRAPCRAFPQCRFGAACAFAHPRCKFAAGCTRRHCPYSHSPPPTPSALPPAAAPAPAPPLSSQVVPAANYKSISAVLPNMCKYYPNCANPVCHYYHPKPCRYGKACLNKLECNFYHSDLPANKWRYPVM